VAAQVAPSLAGRELAAAFALVCLCAALVAFGMLHALTRPLRRLAAQVQGIRTDGQMPAQGPRNEVALLEGAVAALRQRVDQQFRQLQEADQLRRDLVSGISHDLRTPLAILRGNLETLLIKSEVFDASRRAQCVGTALQQSERLRQRIVELFELSRLEAGQVEPRLEPFCLAELLQDVVQGYQSLARARGVQVALAEPSHRHAPVLADIALIERVLQNLVDNALRFTAPGGCITLAVLAEGGQFRVSVADTGRGIAAEHLPHIFERYWRSGDEDELRQGASSGLGLAIVKRILDIHGSVVAVSSELARGTRFEFELPVLDRAP
jgi:signal transduction histidine kinase